MTLRSVAMPVTVAAIVFDRSNDYELEDFLPIISFISKAAICGGNRSTGQCAFQTSVLVMNALCGMKLMTLSAHLRVRSDEIAAWPLEHYQFSAPSEQSESNGSAIQGSIRVSKVRLDARRWIPMCHVGYRLGAMGALRSFSCSSAR